MYYSRLISRIITPAPIVYKLAFVSLWSAVIVSLSLIYLILSPFSNLALSQEVLDSLPELQKIDVIEHLGEQVPLNLAFTDDRDSTVTLAKYFHRGKPVIVVLAYYNCPMLCTLVLNGLTDAINKVSLNPGDDYDIITVSIDPGETSQLARSKKSNQIAGSLENVLDHSWAFLVGDSSQSAGLADVLGFKYYYDTKNKLYAHPAVVFVLTEDAVISRYLYGIQFNDRDLKLSLVEASKGKVGNTIDRLILYCYHYDPQSKGYVVFAANIMKLGGAATLLILSMVLGLLWKRDKMNNARSGHSSERVIK